MNFRGGFKAYLSDLLSRVAKHSLKRLESLNPIRSDSNLFINFNHLKLMSSYQGNPGKYHMSRLCRLTSLNFRRTLVYMRKLLSTLYYYKIVTLMFIHNRRFADFYTNIVIAGQ